MKKAKPTFAHELADHWNDMKGVIASVMTFLFAVTLFVAYSGNSVERQVYFERTMQCWKFEPAGPRPEGLVISWTCRPSEGFIAYGRTRYLVHGKFHYENIKELGQWETRCEALAAIRDLHGVDTARELMGKADGEAVTLRREP